MNMTVVDAEEFEPQDFPLVVEPVQVATQTVRALVDNGANANSIAEEAFERIQKFSLFRYPIFL